MATGRSWAAVQPDCLDTRRFAWDGLICCEKAKRKEKREKARKDTKSGRPRTTIPPLTQSPVDVRN